ncbi:MAG: protein-L-isoaspartate O-methyltransferase family protein [Thermaurantiacus tibetensis]|uniref:protein-L-isoaspartate O-methyltransferase family protein n=1 Tax=Thermaurantiacus tibetensis TaxID=2759035 RepID=UPI00188F454E|nr:protein-L-isoaspartate O-methyltransferase [Thermaurantiacus tibetensis]
MASVAAEPLARARLAMIESQLMPCGIVDHRLVEAFRRVPREAFVTSGRQSMAYAETVQPMGAGRWMPTPLATARLLAAADVPEGASVLLVGAGTGYTAALLAELGARVVALESEPTLAARARSLLGAWPNVSVAEGPLPQGWPEAAPYDRVLFDGAVEHVPDAIAGQLAPAGRVAAILAGQDGVHRVARGVAVRPEASDPEGARPYISWDYVAECPAPILPGFTLPRTFRF